MFALRPAPATRATAAGSAPVGPVSGRAPRPGYDATPEIAEMRIRRMLADEPVVWLSTVRRDGSPSLVPTWFWWDGETITVFSKPEAAKVANLRANPRLMVALGHPEEDFEVGLLEAEAYVGRDLATVPAAFFAKYRDRLADAGLDAPTFRATYTLAIRIVPVRYLGWHGRGARHDRPAAVSRARRLLAGARTRIASLRGPGFPRVAAPAIPAPAAPRGATHPVSHAALAPRLPAWA